MNTIFLAKGFLVGIAGAGFLISWVWVGNVNKVRRSNLVDRFVYSCGAMVGGVVGYLFTKFLFSIYI